MGWSILLEYFFHWLGDVARACYSYGWRSFKSADGQFDTVGTAVDTARRAEQWTHERELNMGWTLISHVRHSVAVIFSLKKFPCVGSSFLEPVLCST